MGGRHEGAKWTDPAMAIVIAVLLLLLAVMVMLALMLPDALSALAPLPPHLLSAAARY
jgi:hypothetical protein